MGPKLTQHIDKCSADNWLGVNRTADCYTKLPYTSIDTPPRREMEDEVCVCFIYIVHLRSYHALYSYIVTHIHVYTHIIRVHPPLLLLPLTLE